jgi:2-desacetyl-2-hydroxyethyl bacteriochlorophyllide A dehydrogenase
MRARELWFTAPRTVEVRAGRVPSVAAGTVLLRALASGVSQGTELLLYRGEGPTPFDPSLDVEGAPTYPRRYGYAWVGEVVATGDGVALTPGTRVFSLAPHGDVHLAEAAAVRPIPEAVPPARAVLAANLETAVTCVWDAGIALGDDVVVLGGGVVGLLVSFLALRGGARVRLVEPSPRRRQLAGRLGVLEALPPAEAPPRGDADVVIEATGNPATLDVAIAHAATEATIAVASFYGARTHAVSLGGAFHRKRLAVRSTQVSRIPPSRAPRWTPDRRFELVGRLLEEAALDALLDEPVPFDEAPRAYARLDAAPAESGQIVFDYRESS